MKLFASHARNIFAAALLTAISMLSLSSCNEQPTTVGYSFVTDTIRIVTTSTDKSNLVTGYENYKHLYPTIPGSPIFNSLNNSVGRWNGGAAVSVIRPGGVPDTLGHIRTEDIISAKLYMQPLAPFYGNASESRTFGFKLYRVIKLFKVETNWNDFFPTPDLKSSPFIDNGKTLAEFSGKLGMSEYDSLMYDPDIDSLVLDFDKETVADWFRMQADTNLGQQRYGFAIIPNEDCDIIRQFNSAVSTSDTSAIQPFIEVIYNNNDDIDTVHISAKEGVSISLADFPEPNGDRIALQGLVAYRSKLFFDVSEIPAYSGVHKAELELTLDPDQSFFGYGGADSIFYAEMDIETAEDEAKWGYYAKKDTTRENKYVFTILTSAVEIWTKRGGTGALNLQMTLKDEIKKMNRLVFYGPDAEEVDKRPKFKVIYSLRPNEFDDPEDTEEVE